MNKNKNIHTASFKQNLNIKWALKVLLLSFTLSVSFSLLSDIVLTHTSFIISIIMIILFMLVGVIADMIGVAITSCSEESLNNIRDEKIKKICFMLTNNSDKISVICCDIIGDICSILSGACGASIVYKLITIGFEGFADGIISASVSGLIACLTIFFKSLEKRIAVTKSSEITYILSKCINKIKKWIYAIKICKKHTILLCEVIKINAFAKIYTGFV